MKIHYTYKKIKIISSWCFEIFLLVLETWEKLSVNKLILLTILKISYNCLFMAKVYLKLLSYV